MSFYSDFDRAVLRNVIEDVRRHKPDVRLRDAWVYHFDSDHWEFHYGEFYWHGSAGSAYEARSEGWSAWLRAQGVGGYA